MIKRYLFLILSLIVLGSINTSVIADNGLETIQDYLDKVLPPQEGRRIVYDETSGMLTVTDTPSNHKIIKNLLDVVDVAPPQVMIKASFVETNLTDISELGVEWYWYRRPKLHEDTLDALQIGNSPFFSNPDNRTPSDGITWPVSDPEGGEAGECFPRETKGLDMFIGKTTYSGSYLRAHLHALQQQGKINLLSAPQVTTLSGQTANMQAVRTIPYVCDVEFENQGSAEHPIWVLIVTADEKDIGISLEATPHVSEGSKYITLDLHPQVDVLVAQRSIRPPIATVQDIYVYDDEGNLVDIIPGTVYIPGVSDEVGWPIIETRSTQTSVVVRSGQTVVLGGMIKEEENIIKKKVPLLGNIPLIGKLFSHEYTKKEKKNLLIFITATLITPDGREIK